MKYCNKCGTQLEDDAMFCEKCGEKVIDEAAGDNSTKVQESDVNQTNQSNELFNKLKGLSKKTYGLIAAAVVAVVVVFMIISNLKNRININDYITVEFTGYNTVGNADLNFDEDAFITDILKKNGIKVTSLEDLTGKNLEKATKIYTKLLDDSQLDIVLDKDSNLSNGDKVKLEIKVNKDLGKNLGVSFKSKSKEYKVADLKEAKMINPFDYVEVTYSGIAPNVSVSINVKEGADTTIQNLRFSADKSSKISVGDKITVKVTNDLDSIASKGYILSETSKEYTCEKADEYISDITKLSADQLKELQQDATDKIESELAGYEDLTMADLTFEGSYILQSKSNSYYSNNILYLVYSANVSAPEKSSYNKGFENSKIYMPVQFSSVILKADDSIKHDSGLYIKGYSDLTMGWSSLSGYTDGTKMYKELITQNKDSYTYKVDGNISEFGK